MDQVELPTELRSALRFFGYWLGNGTLLLSIEANDQHADYLDALLRPGDLIGETAAVFVNAVALGAASPADRAAHWLRAQLCLNHVVDPPFTAQEVVMEGLGRGWPDAIKRFAFDLGRGT